MKKVWSLLLLFVMISSLRACIPARLMERLDNEKTHVGSMVQSEEKKSDKEILTGEWVLSEGKTDLETITFYSDGTCLVDNDENGTWTIVDNTLKVLGAYGGQFFDHDNIIGEYSLSGDTLIFTDPIVDGRKREGQIIYRKDK